LTAACLSAAAFSQQPNRNWYDLNDRALSKLDFDGIALPTNLEQFQEQFPAAKRDQQRVDRELGLECYVVDDLKGLDSARFYFCDGTLYQFEAVYEPQRITALGGMQQLLAGFIDRWGPVDHAGESRWTWQRPVYHRRADLYARASGAQLTITDTTKIPVITRRTSRLEEERDVDRDR
jgi:hypothetical protein